MARQLKSRWMQSALALGVAVLLASCSDVSTIQKNSPANPYKDYKEGKELNRAIVGVGEPISKQQMKADAVLSMSGTRGLEEVMHRIAGTYNVAVRWGNGVRKGRAENVVVNALSFDEARAYIEDVFKVQIIREGDRRLLVLPSASEAKIEEFSPGVNIVLSQAVRGLAQQCGFNVVIPENKAQLNNVRVTTALKNLSCYDAFDALLAPHGMSLEDRGDYMTIGGLPSRQWTLSLHEQDRTDEKEASYKSSFSGNSEESGSAQELGGSAKVTIKSERKLWDEVQKDLTQLIQNSCIDSQLSEGEGETSTAGAGSELLPPPSLSGGAAATTAAATSTADAGLAGGTDSTALSCGYISINKSVGLVQMRAPRDVLDQADEIIRRVEDIASRRLLLEARVLAVKRDHAFDQGGTISVDDGQVLDQNGFSSVTAAIQESLSQSTGNGGGLALGLAGNLEAAVRLVEKFGTTYQLMQPMLELMDRQQATLVDGSSKPFIVREAVTETTASGTTTNFNTELKYQFFGLQFSASAQIADEGEPHTVSIQIPILSQIGEFESPIYSGATQIGSDKIPIPETRLIDQKVRVRDNEIKVAGGLTKNIAIDREAGVPLLREAPVVGKLAGQEGITFEKIEFVVLLQVRRLY
ncbi:MAG: hypothetical protein WAX89_02445 [Alphaproteobacteria bacterium]